MWNCTRVQRVMRTSDCPMKKKEIPELIVLLLACCLLIGAIYFAGHYVFENSDLAIFENYALNHAAPPESVVVDYLNSLHFAGDGTACVFSSDGTRLYVDVEPSGDDGMKLYRKFTDAWSFKIDNATSAGTSARVKVYITCPDTSLLTEAVQQKAEQLMTEKVTAATDGSQIYNAENGYLEEVKTAVCNSAFDEVLNGDLSGCMVNLESMIELQFSDRQWHVTNETALSNTLDKRAYEIRLGAANGLPYIPLSSGVAAEDAESEESSQTDEIVIPEDQILYDIPDETFDGLGREADI